MDGWMDGWVQQEWYVDYDAQLRATIDSASGLRSVQINVRTIIVYLFYLFYLFVCLFVCLFVYLFGAENAVQHQRGSAALHRLPAEGRHAAHGRPLCTIPAPR
jgi:hypothetical protein